MSRKSGSTLVCECFGVCETEILSAMGNGAKTLKSLMRRTHAGEGCTFCHPLLRRYIKERRDALRYAALSSVTPPP